jgi:hypothetical protein
VDANSRDWQDEGAEDCFGITGPFDPLAELAADLALCFDAVAESRGTFCTACTCSLNYHLSCDDGVCELCGCEDIYRECLTCGKSRQCELYAVGSNTCNYCINFSPVKILPIKVKDKYEMSVDWVECHNRDKEARMVLRELSD